MKLAKTSVQRVQKDLEMMKIPQDERNAISPLYTDIRYNDQTRYNDKLNGTDSWPKIDRLMERFKNIYLILQETNVVDIC